MGLGAELKPQRACSNGEVVDIGRNVPAAKEAAPTGAMPPATVQGSGVPETDKR